MRRGKVTSSPSREESREELTAGISHLRKRKVEDAEDEEAHKEVGLLRP